MARKDRENSDKAQETVETGRKLGPSVGEVMRYGLDDMRRTWEQVAYGRDPTPDHSGTEPSDLTGQGANLFKEFFGSRGDDDRPEGRDQEREQDRDIER